MGINVTMMMSIEVIRKTSRHYFIGARVNTCHKATVKILSVSVNRCTGLQNCAWTDWKKFIRILLLLLFEKDNVDLSWNSSNGVWGELRCKLLIYLEQMAKQKIDFISLSFFTQNNICYRVDTTTAVLEKLL